MNVIIGLIFACIGALLAFLGIKKQQNCTEVTTGKIVDISREIRDDTDYDSSPSIVIGSRYTGREIALYPIYEYTVGENKVTAKSNESVNGAFIGQTVEIHYNPDKPNEFYVGKNGNITQIIGGLITAIVGIVLIFVKM